MALFSCGDKLRYGRYEAGSSGCLMRFPEFPDHVLLLAAGHVVLPTFARAGDAITVADSEDIIGRLFTWTTIDGSPTTDAALIWVDPSMVSAQLRGLGAPSGFNLNPVEGTRVRIVPHAGQQTPRETLIASVDKDVEVLVAGPGWDYTPKITYRRQILTERLITEGGDSGAIVLDDQNRVVGMVVAGSPDAGTVITPIFPILTNAAWGGKQLDLVSKVGTDSVAPPMPAPLPELAEPNPALDFSWLGAAQKGVAIEVAARLSAGGLGLIQQAAALANAMGESSLNPTEHNQSNEDSVGLFQMNRSGGRGKGHTVQELQRIDVQCQIVLDWASKEKPEFKTLRDLDEAVALFVVSFERPKDKQGAIDRRTPFAHRFLPG